MKFSILMSVYSKENPEYLAQSLQSLTDQTLKSNEVILVEDGPLGPELKDVIESFRKKLNITSVRLETNSGLAVALNEGLKHCTYELVARMDSDDVSLPHRFEKQVAFMVANPEVVVSSAWIEERSVDMQSALCVRSVPQSHEQIAAFAKSRSPISHPVVIYKKSAVLGVGGYPVIYPEDYLLWCLLISKGYTLRNIPEVLLQMRTGDDFITRRGYNFLKGQIKIYWLMKKIEFIGWPIFIMNVASCSVVRLSPRFIKKQLYKHARGKL